MPKNILFNLLFKIVIELFLLIIFPSFSHAATTTTIVEWNFEDAIPNQIADAGITANLTETITRESSYLHTYTYPNGFNNVGNALSSTYWDNGVDLKYWQVKFNTLGYQSLTISSKQRSSDTGPKDFRLQYSSDSGTTWVDIPGSSFSLLANTWNSSSINNFSLPSECDNQNSVLIRWVIDSNTSANGNTIASGGTNRIDDILITGIEIPLTSPSPSPSVSLSPSPLVSPSSSPSPSLFPSPSPLLSPSPSISSSPSPSPITPELSGSITGFVFYDTNNNNQWDGLFKREFKLGGWKIFIDINENNKFDRGEKFTFTNLFSLKSFGQYSYTKLFQGDYRICEILPMGWFSSLPNQSNCQLVTLTNGENKIDINFGNYFARLKLQSLKLSFY